MHDVQDNEAESLPYSGFRGLQKKNCHFDPILHILHIFSYPVFFVRFSQTFEFHSVYVYSSSLINVF